jgi:hypothetical protein
MFGTKLDVTVIFCIQCKDESNRKGAKPNLGQEIFEQQKTVNIKFRF